MGQLLGQLEALIISLVFGVTLQQQVSRHQSDSVGRKGGADQ